MFNYYYYLFNNRYQESAEDLQTYPPEMHALASAQKEQMIQIIRTFFKTTNLSVLRQVRKLQLEPVDEVDNKYIFNDLPKFYREMFTELYKEKDYDLLFELLFNYSAGELDLLAQLKDMDMSGEDLLTFITLNEDPYKWYNDMNEII